MLHEDSMDDFYDDVALELAPVSGPDAWKFQAISQAQIDLMALSGRGAGADEWIELEDAATLLTREFPPTPWAVRGLLTLRSVTAVAGEPKTTKTWVALELGLAIATGTRAFGEFPPVGEPGGVVFVMAEDNAQSARNRLRALAAGRGVDLVASGCARNVHVLTMARLDLGRPRDVARLVAAVRRVPNVRAVVLDPLVNLHSADEDKAQAMTPIMGAMRSLRDLLDCCVIFVHHAAKSSEATKARRPGQRMRGSGSIHGAVDGGIYLSDLDTDGQSKWTNTAHIELKSAKGAGSFRLVLNVEDDANDEAVRATWEQRPVNAGAKAKDEDVVMVAMQELEGDNPGAYHNLETIRVAAGKRKLTVTGVLRTLVAERLLERGHGGGWRVRK
jgi:hypothetical protein